MNEHDRTQLAPVCQGLQRRNALLTPGELERLAPFEIDFCLTDVVCDFWSFPDENARASCSIWLVTPSEGTSEVLFNFSIDKMAGHQIHLTSGIFCPANSYLSVSAWKFVEGSTASFRILITGSSC